MAQRTPTPAASDKPRTPQFATRSNGMEHPFLDVSPPYVLTFHIQRWMVHAGRLVPSLQKVTLSPGVNGVSVNREGKINFADARSRLETEGRIVVPYEWGPGGTYLLPIDTRPNGGKDVVETWISCWEEATVGSTETYPNTDGYAEWLASLVTDGKLPACPVSVASRMLDVARERLEKARSDSAKNGGAGKSSIRAKAIAQEVEVLEAYLEAAKDARGKPVAPKSARNPEVA